jgi:hypothetical protein
MNGTTLTFASVMMLMKACIEWLGHPTQVLSPLKALAQIKKAFNPPLDNTINAIFMDEKWL